jgi:hypothetical protein
VLPVTYFVVYSVHTIHHDVDFFADFSAQCSILPLRQPQGLGRLSDVDHHPAFHTRTRRDQYDRCRVDMTLCDDVTTGTATYNARRTPLGVRVHVLYHRSNCSFRERLLVPESKTSRIDINPRDLLRNYMLCCGIKSTPLPSNGRAPAETRRGGMCSSDSI